jgi:hypothetical protein
LKAIPENSVYEKTTLGPKGLTLPSVGANFKRLERKLSKGFSQDFLFMLPTFLG